MAVVLAGAGLVGALAPVAAATGAPRPAVTVDGGAVTVDGAPVAEAAGRADRAALDAAVRAMVSPGGSTAALGLVVERGRPAWKGAAGTADLATGAPASPTGGSGSAA
ncbi:hypothetical protein ACFQ0M_05875 [Kitasatospora aburaviensis]